VLAIEHKLQKQATMRDKRRDPSHDLSTPVGPARPGLPHNRGDLQPNGYGVDRNREAGDGGKQPGRGFYIDEFRVPTSLEAGVMMDSLPRSWSSRGVGVVRLLTTIAVAAAAAAATVLVAPVFLSPPAQKASSDRADGTVQVDRPAAAPEEPANAPPPRLAGVDAVTQDVDEAVSLNLSLLGVADGGFVVIRGLAAGSAVAGGRPLGAGTWRIDAARLQDARVRPPRGFTGQMDLTLELRLADDSIADRRSVRLEWVGGNKMTALVPPDTRTPAAEPQASDPRVAVRPEQRQAIASLVSRGKELLRNGDFSSARLILQRAADESDADAALTLGSTYDPVILTRLGIRNQVANVELARTWYEKAQEFGSTEAAARLKTLSNR
jgi:hypothetical protein